MIDSLLFMTPKETYMFSKEIYKLMIDSQLRHEQSQDTNFLAKGRSHILGEKCINTQDLFLKNEEM